MRREQHEIRGDRISEQILQLLRLLALAPDRGHDERGSAIELGPRTGREPLGDLLQPRERSGPSTGSARGRSGDGSAPSAPARTAPPAPRARADSGANTLCVRRPRIACSSSIPPSLDAAAARVHALMSGGQTPKQKQSLLAHAQAARAAQNRAGGARTNARSATSPSCRTACARTAVPTRARTSSTPARKPPSRSSAVPVRSRAPAARAPRVGGARRAPRGDRATPTCASCSPPTRHAASG